MATTQQLRAEAAQIGDNIADLTATCVRMGERSDWQDERIGAIEADIASCGAGCSPRSNRLRVAPWLYGQGASLVSFTGIPCSQRHASLATPTQESKEW